MCERLRGHNFEAHLCGVYINQEIRKIYSLCVSNLRMMVSMMVVFGATWPRLTGIFMCQKETFCSSFS